MGDRHHDEVRHWGGVDAPPLDDTELDDMRLTLDRRDIIKDCLSNMETNEYSSIDLPGTPERDD